MHLNTDSMFELTVGLMGMHAPQLYRSVVLCAVGHGDAKVNCWEQPTNISNWKEEHVSALYRTQTLCYCLPDLQQNSSCFNGMLPCRSSLLFLVAGELASTVQ